MKPFALLLAAISTVAGSIALAPAASAATTYLILGSYAQGPGGKPTIMMQTSPSVQVVPMESLEQCEAAGRQITAKIYKPIWYFDGRWTCVEGK